MKILRLPKIYSWNWSNQFRTVTFEMCRNSTRVTKFNYLLRSLNFMFGFEKLQLLGWLISKHSYKPLRTIIRKRNILFKLRDRFSFRLTKVMKWSKKFLRYQKSLPFINSIFRVKKFHRFWTSDQIEPKAIEFTERVNPN